MTFTIISRPSSDDKTYVHANGQAKMQVEYIPEPFDDALNMRKTLLMERDLGIRFNRREALS